MNVQMPLRLLLPFLEGAVRLLVEQVRNAAVVRSLRRSENLQVREDLTKSKQRYVHGCRSLLVLCCLYGLEFAKNACCSS